MYALRLSNALATVAFLAGLAVPSAAQGPRSAVRWPKPVPAAPFTSLSTPPLLAIDSAKIAPTHWKAGALIGGGFLGLLGAAIGVGLSCYDGPCSNRLLGAVGGFALGGILGFGLGAMIGGQFPAPPP
jgi:hypothetical protein